MQEVLQNYNYSQLYQELVVHEIAPLRGHGYFSAEKFLVLGSTASQAPLIRLFHFLPLICEDSKQAFSRKNVWLLVLPHPRTFLLIKVAKNYYFTPSPFYYNISKEVL